MTDPERRLLLMLAKVSMLSLRSSVTILPEGWKGFGPDEHGIANDANGLAAQIIDGMRECTLVRGSDTAKRRD